MIGLTTPTRGRGALSSMVSGGPVEVVVGDPRLRRAVILGASPGTILCPVTALRPRHLWPIGNTPMLARLIESLKASGIQSAILSCPRTDDIAVIQTLRSHADAIGLDLAVITESRPLGTAGAVRAAAPFADDEHLMVISGTTLLGGIDCRIGDIRARWDPDADASVAMRRACADAAADASPVSAGLWFLGPAALRAIPANGHHSIDEQLIPALVSAGASVRHFDMPTSLEVRNAFEGYHEAHARLLETEAAGRATIARTASVHPSARIIGPVAIGEHTRVCRGAIIQGPCSIGSNCTIGDGVRIDRCIVWDDVRIAEGAGVRESILVDHADIPAGARVADTVVLSRKETRSVAPRAFKAVDQSVMISGTRRGRRTAPRLVPALDRSPATHMNDAIKRIIDIIVAVLMLIVTSPVLLVAAIAVKLDSPGSVFFSQARAGRGGRPFTMFKLRTMVANAHELQTQLRGSNEVDGPMFKIDRDPRVTRVGAVLRKTCIDELPQLFNVLRGDMSLVGPRPLATHEMAIVGGWRDIRLMVRPGITGMWQVDGRSQLSFGDWIYHDIRYVMHQSLLLDVRIMVKTVAIVIGCASRAGELGRDADPVPTVGQTTEPSRAAAKA